MLLASVCASNRMITVWPAYGVRSNTSSSHRPTGAVLSTVTRVASQVPSARNSETVKVSKLPAVSAVARYHQASRVSAVGASGSATCWLMRSLASLTPAR